MGGDGEAVFAGKGDRVHGRVEGYADDWVKQTAGEEGIDEAEQKVIK